MDGEERKMSWDELAKQNTKLKAKIERLKEERDKYREAAEIFRDFGEFENACSHYDRQQLRRARWTMTGRQVNESDSPQTGG